MPANCVGSGYLFKLLDVEQPVRLYFFLLGVHLAARYPDGCLPHDRFICSFLHGKSEYFAVLVLKRPGPEKEKINIVHLTPSELNSRRNLQSVEFADLGQEVGVRQSG